MKRIIMLLLCVGVITMGFSGQGYGYTGSLDFSGWNGLPLGGVITGDATFTGDATIKLQFFSPQSMPAGWVLKVTGNQIGGAGLLIFSLGGAQDCGGFSAVNTILVAYDNTNVTGSTQNNGDGTYTWTTVMPAFTVHGCPASMFHPDSEQLDISLFWGSWRITKIEVGLPDMTPPVVEITHPKDGDFAAAALNVNGISIDDVDGPLPVTISINDVVLTPDADGNFGGQIVGPSTGNITINAEAVDSSGNVGTDSVTILRVHDNRK